ncbi:hypothetical protein BGZ54_002227 [Gamsiella multidivaricata]|nr:hypothetical protein BGZ54_002227 [Gamsiella multidivaricata]
MGGPQPIGPLSIAALLDHRHSQTLETLDIKHCSAIESRHIQLILTSCPNLASFRSLTDTENQYEYESRLDISDLPLRSGAGPAWVCKGLKDLRIGFTGFSTLLDKEPVQPYVDYIFRQLSVLTNLQTLYLAGETTATAFSASSRAWAFDFSLASGLGRLQSLRMLTTLNIQRLRHHRIGKGEAEWMIRHWPLLRRLYVQPELSRVENMGYNGDTIHEDRTLTGFLEELVRCRPSLTVSVGA